MKTRNFLFLLSFLFVIFATHKGNAQTTLNPFAGLHLSSFSGNFKDTSNLDSRVGYQFGLNIRKGNDFFFLNPGISYRITSADVKKSIETPGNLKELTGTTTVQTLAIPINGGFYITGKDVALLRIFLHGGFTPSYTIGIKSPEKFNLSPTELNRFQAALNLGVGFDILFLNIDLNYEYGLIDYFKNSSGINKGLVLNVGFVF